MADADGGTNMGTTRRTLVRGAAWSVPVVAVSATAPAFAASPVPCPVMPASSTAWATSTSGTLGPASTGGYGWSPTASEFNVYRDNGSMTQPLTIRSTATISVLPRATYAISFPFYWGYGNGVDWQSTEGTFSVLFDGVVQKSLTTRTAAVDANAGTFGSQPGTTNQTFTYTVPVSTTSLQVEYRYVISARGIFAANDDINVGRLVFDACTVN